MMEKHYSLGYRIIIQKHGEKYYILGKKFKDDKIFSLSKNYNLDEAASNLYKIFRLVKRYKRSKL